MNTCSGGLDALRLLVVGEGESVSLGDGGLEFFNGSLGVDEGIVQAVVVVRGVVEEVTDSLVVEGVGVVVQVAEGLDALGNASVAEVEASRQASEVLADIQVVGFHISYGGG